MGTLREFKLELLEDENFTKSIARSLQNEILIDLDEDGNPDIALLDSSGNGNIDTFAIDLNGNGEFDLVVLDTNNNGIPDQILFDVEGNGELVEVASGEEVEAAVIDAIEQISTLVAMQDVMVDALDERLELLEKEIGEAREELKKLKS